MTGQWDWILDGGLADADSLMFIRGKPLQRVIEAYGMVPGNARVLPYARAQEAIRAPVRDGRGVVLRPWIRVGTSGDWAFVLDETWTGPSGSDEELAAGLSAGTETAWVSWADGTGSFEFRVNGEVITWFDPVEPWARYGAQPDRFVVPMREVGLAVDKPRRGTAPASVNPWTAVLELLTLALGIRLERDVALGPLLTVQSDTIIDHGTWITDGEEAPSGWDWVRETALDIGGSFVFARGASPERVMTAFGMNPARARLVPASDVDEALHHPDWLETHPPEHPWIRVGVAGEWGFAIDESSGGYGGYEDDAARELSAGTEAVLFTHTQTIDYFHYYVNGTEVTAFEPLRGWERSGTEPDRFAEQMRQVGLRMDVDDDDDDVADPVTGLLEMLTVALGIWVPRDIALGPLLTVQRD